MTVVKELNSDSIKRVLNKVSDNITKMKTKEKEQVTQELIEKYRYDLVLYVNDIKTSFEVVKEVVLEKYEISKNDDNLQFIHFYLKNMIAGYFTNVMREQEGLVCSVDKGRFIANKCFESLVKQRNLSLYDDYSYDDYSKVEHMKVKYEGKQVHWSPKTLKDTNAAFKLLEIIGIKISFK